MGPSKEGVVEARVEERLIAVEKPPLLPLPPLLAKLLPLLTNAEEPPALLLLALLLARPLPPLALAGKDADGSINAHKRSGGAAGALAP